MTLLRGRLDGAPAAAAPRLLALALCAAIAGAAGRAGYLRPECSCGQLGPPLLLQRRPCSCIRASTPRAELEAMGEVGLRAHLQRCEQGHEELQKQSAYEASSWEAQDERVQGNIEDLNRSFNSQQEKLRRKANETAVESARLTEESHSLQLRRAELDRAYSEAFTAWYKLTAELSQKMARLHSCSCKAASLLARRRQLGSLAPDKSTMYDLLAKVEKCEAASEVLSDDIREQQSRGRGASLQAAEDVQALKRRMADREHLAHTADRGSVVAELRRGRDVLRDAAAAQQAQVSEYGGRNADLEEHSAALEEELLRCGC